MHVNHVADSDHPNDDAIAAYVEGTLDRDERQTIDAHIAGCPPCRQVLVETSVFHAQDTWYKELSDWCWGRWQLLRFKLTHWA
jgi:hypothetical protein